MATLWFHIPLHVDVWNEKGESLGKFQPSFHPQVTLGRKKNSGKRLSCPSTWEAFIWDGDVAIRDRRARTAKAKVMGWALRQLSSSVGAHRVSRGRETPRRAFASHQGPGGSVGGRVHAEAIGLGWSLGSAFFRQQFAGYLVS